MIKNAWVRSPLGINLLISAKLQVWIKSLSTISRLSPLPPGAYLNNQSPLDYYDAKAMGQICDQGMGGTEGHSLNGCVPIP